LLIRFFFKERQRIENEDEETVADIERLEAETASLSVLQTSTSTAAKQITRSDITELKSFANPPDIIQRLLICLSALLNEKPDWATAKNVR
jgi:hypothetical protein